MDDTIGYGSANWFMRSRGNAGYTALGTAFPAFPGMGGVVIEIEPEDFKPAYVKCEYCGSKQVATKEQCSQCGATLPTEERGV